MEKCPKNTNEKSKNIIEDNMILGLLKLNENGWKGGQYFENRKNSLGLTSDELLNFNNKVYVCTEYYAEGIREGTFRFVTLKETITNKILKIYFTSDHYETFLEINI